MRLLLFLLACLLLLNPTVSSAQQDTGTPIEFSGTVESINEDGTIVVNGLIVDISNLDEDTQAALVVGVEVIVAGTLQDGVVTANSIMVQADDQPSVTLDKAVSTDGENWDNANTAPGPEIELDDEIYFLLRATNNSDAPLENPVFSDSLYDTSGCEVPEAIAPGETIDCVIGPLEVAEGQQQNIATIAGTVEGQAITDFDTAHYFGGELDDDDEDDDQTVIIVIEGPVQQIINNIIVIYNIEIEIDINDPILTVIQVGDVIRVEGEQLVGGVVIVVNIIFIDIDVVIVGDLVWRDPGDCSNPPPAWAPAVGWRTRCEGGGDRGGGRGGGGRDNDDDDDDD